jgi:threonyl-tRNA synthetase
MNAKIRLAQTQKIPYTLVVGEKEQNEESVTVRFRGGAQAVMKAEEFVQYIAKKISSRSLDI